MDPDTAIGGPNGRFPATRISAVEALRSPDAVERTRGYEALVAGYWKPVYKYIRIKWRKSNEDSKDLTQAFFARAIEKDFLLPYDPAKATFRTFPARVPGRISGERESSREPAQTRRRRHHGAARFRRRRRRIGPTAGLV